MNRRHFLRTVGAGAAVAALTPGRLLAARPLHLVLLHTNDTHSRIDPFPMDGGRLQGLGGVARRATLVRRLRASHPHVLLLDSGDIFQGTPYFNFFEGEIEFKTMSAMGYDLATLGNHDFDNGVDGLVKMLPHADFDFVSANYVIEDEGLAPRVAPYAIREFAGTKVGIFGLGIDFDGLVLKSLHQGVTYTDPHLVAAKTVEALREQGCALIVCLSHLGFRYREDRPSDMTLAHEVEGIDIILGGYTHTFLDEPHVVSRFGGGETTISQVGWGGVRLGRVDVFIGRSPDRPQVRTSPGYQMDARFDRG